MDLTAFANDTLAGFNQTLGLRFTQVELDRVLATVPIGPHLLQPYGIVHGGVYASIAETICSVGAAVSVLPTGRNVVGLDNQTSFLRACREGTLHATATPVHRGRRTHLWQAEVCDDEGRVVATSRVRLMVLDGGASLAGKTVGIER